MGRDGKKEIKKTKSGAIKCEEVEKVGRVSIYKRGKVYGWAS